MKRLIALALVVFANFSYAWEQTPARPLEACAKQMPYGIPQSQTRTQGLCRLAYATAIDNSAKLPVWTSYVLTPPNALGCVTRTNAFVADKSVAGSARPDDYAGTGYDKGHVAPDGDMSWDQQVEYESFLMTNMMPQLPGLNRGIWKQLETTIRGWVVQQGQSYTIYAGPIYSANAKRIGAGVAVPDAFYKIAVNNQTGATMGWIFPHRADLNELVDVRVPVKVIIEKTGIRFGLPQGGKEVRPGQEPAVDFGALTNAKRAKCK
jgi:endonuclease G